MSDATMAMPTAPRWIVSRRFDLTWFLGGAALTLVVLGLYFGLGVSILVLWWVWLLGFDGPHIAAAFTRTYLDKQEWRRRSGMLLVSLLSFVVGPACLVIGHLVGSDDPFLLFLGVATFYGYYHVVRQHYGFLALYKAVNRNFDRFDFHFDKWFLYVGCWAPYFYFLIVHPRARALIPFLGERPIAAWDRVVAGGLIVLWIVALAAFVARAIAQLHAQGNRPKVLFLLITVPLYGFAYFFVGRFEPVYAHSQGPDQDFLLISVLITLYHNIQYLGLVWFHNRNRYGVDAAAGGDFGVARWVNRTQMRFLSCCALFSFIYLAIACWTGVFPGCQLFLNAQVGPYNVNQIGLAIWWGLAIHHYYLDQKIWRIRGNEELKRNLGLAG